MKKLCCVSALVAVFAATGIPATVSAVEEEPKFQISPEIQADFERQKTDLIKKLDHRINTLQSARECVLKAKNSRDVVQCRPQISAAPQEPESPQPPPPPPGREEPLRRPQPPAGGRPQGVIIPAGTR